MARYASHFSAVGQAEARQQQLEETLRESIKVCDGLQGKQLQLLRETQEEREAQAAERRVLLHTIAMLGITLHVEKLRAKFLAGDFSMLRRPKHLLDAIEAEEDGR